MRIKAIVNGENTIYLTEFSSSRFVNDPSLKIQSDDLNYIKELFTNLQKLEIYFDENKIAEYTEYDGYSAIKYLGLVFCENENRFVDCLQVTLTKVNLIERVNIIEKLLDDSVDYYSMTVDEYKEYLLNDISKKGEAQIFAGAEITLTDGTKKVFTYNLEDQLNVLNFSSIIKEIDNPNMLYPYHSHGEPCELYTVRDLMIIYFTLQMMSVQVQTRVNLLLNYIRTINDKELLMSINYNTPLPANYQSKYNEIILASMQIMQQMQNRYFVEEQSNPTNNELEEENVFANANEEPLVEVDDNENNDE